MSKTEMALVGRGPLCVGTDDLGQAMTEPGPRPLPGQPHYWYRRAKPRFYRPYLVRVIERDDDVMRFVFLDALTGQDLALSELVHRVAYHDARYAYGGLPSTAPRVIAGTGADCGMLLLSDEYLERFPAADREALATAGPGSDKWPRSLGADRPRRAQTSEQTGHDGDGDGDGDAGADGPPIEDIQLDESVA